VLRRVDGTVEMQVHAEAFDGVYIVAGMQDQASKEVARRTSIIERAASGAADRLSLHG
jgi:hypothetical protein